MDKVLRHGQLETDQNKEQVCWLLYLNLMDPVVIFVVIASTLNQGVQLKMQHVQNVRRGATMLKSVREKLSQGVKFQQLLALLHSRQSKVPDPS